MAMLMAPIALAAEPNHELRPTAYAHDIRLGHSVAIDGDTMVVGAPYYDGAGSRRGRVYVFTWNGTSWAQATSFSPSGLDDDAFFGWAVDIDAGTILVGAPGEPDDDEDSHVYGAVFLYTGAAGDWSLSERIHPVENVDFVDDDPDDFSQYYVREFGRAVSLDGHTAAVGSTLTHDQGSYVRDGAVWILDRSASRWSIKQLIATMDTNQTNRAEFGESVALDDGVLVVGAPNYYANGNSQDARGIAQVFRYDGLSAYVHVQDLNDPLGHWIDSFGEAVAIDSTGIVVGNSGDDLVGHNTGSVMLFRPSGASWIYETTMTSCSGVDDTTDLGKSVAISGLVVVAGGTSVSSSDDLASSVFVWGDPFWYSTNPGFPPLNSDWPIIGRHEASQVASNAMLGASVAINQGRVASGAPQADRTLGITWVDVGAVFVWDVLADDRDLNGVDDWLQLLTGSHDWDGNCVPDEADCLADWSGPSHSTPDGKVDADDLLDLINCWGVGNGGGTCSRADFNEDLDVGITDLLYVLQTWGACS
jgi:hypothetical protein